mgnify:CR=1 FL=1
MTKKLKGYTSRNHVIECTHCNGDMRAEYEVIKGYTVGNSYLDCEYLECHLCNGAGVIELDADALDELDLDDVDDV